MDVPIMFYVNVGIGLILFLTSPCFDADQKKECLGILAIIVGLIILIT